MTTYYIPQPPSAEEQAMQIREITDNFDTCGGFCELVKSDRIVQRGQQTFAVFSHIAFDVAKLDYTDPERGRFVRIPALLDGHAFAEFPDEGRDGVLFWSWSEHLTRRTGQSKWSLSFQIAAWLHTKELKMTNEEIIRNIINGIDRYETPLTGGGLPGWM